ncbi:MAG: hypothetical protein K2Q21_12570 [Chitinophagaceae bacterium]|nr:hypothetical protein [Chitinophagaceae bacterium]
MKKVKISLFIFMASIAIAGSLFSSKQALAKSSSASFADCNASSCPGSGSTCCYTPDGSRFVKGR